MLYHSGIGPQRERESVSLLAACMTPLVGVTLIAEVLKSLIQHFTSHT